MTSRSIAVIPARGGSKRLPRKNILSFRGRPMLDWTVRAALSSGLFARVLVSTEDAEIAAVAKAAGAEVALRDSSLASDNVSIATVMEALLRGHDGVDAACVLLANCPLRTADDIVAAHARFRATDAVSTISVVEYDWRRPQWALREQEGWLTPVLWSKTPTPLERPEQWLCPTGAVRWLDVRRFLAEPEFYPAMLSGHVMPWQRAIDIDDANDLEVANCVAHALDHGFVFST